MVKYIVKCFIHIGIYAAWSQEIMQREGKCMVRKDLVAMEHNPNCDYVEIAFDKGTTMYLFRGEAGVECFIKEKLLKE